MPNDPQIGSQWHHVESGTTTLTLTLQDVTTGGTTTSGHRIVVAVLEGGGSNYNHPDLIDNHWVNGAEIPNNGIDDDGNGLWTITTVGTCKATTTMWGLAGTGRQSAA